MQNTSEIKEKIIQILRLKGPSIPVHIAKEIEQSILFTSAFLSELHSEKKIKMSNLRVGSSPIYFLKNQEHLLEKFSDNLKSKEKEAFLLLKEKKFLIDEEQQPAIRVALREIKDFAIPFQKENKLIWRYLSVPETEFKEITTKSEIETETQILIEDNKKEESLNIFDKKPKKLIKPKKKASQKKGDKFFNRVKEYLSKKSIEIQDIESIGKNELSFIADIEGKRKLILAYNKKKITETDIIKSHKKAKELKLDYIILSLGEPLKKLNVLINAIKDLDKIGRIE